MLISPSLSSYFWQAETLNSILNENKSKCFTISAYLRQRIIAFRWVGLHRLLLFASFLQLFHYPIFHPLTQNTYLFKNSANPHLPCSPTATNLKNMRPKIMKCSVQRFQVRSYNRNISLSSPFPLLSIITLLHTPRYIFSDPTMFFKLRRYLQCSAELSRRKAFIMCTFKLASKVSLWLQINKLHFGPSWTDKLGMQAFLWIMMADNLGLSFSSRSRKVRMGASAI